MHDVIINIIQHFMMSPLHHILHHLLVFFLSGMGGANSPPSPPTCPFNKSSLYFLTALIVKATSSLLRGSLCCRERGRQRERERERILEFNTSMAAIFSASQRSLCAVLASTCTFCHKGGFKRLGNHLPRCPERKGRDCILTVSL